VKVKKWQKCHVLVGEREILPQALRWAKASYKDAAVPHLRFPGLKKRHPCCNLQVSAGLSALRVLCETRRYRWRQDKKHSLRGRAHKGEREWVAHEKDEWRDESLHTEQNTRPSLPFTFNEIFTHTRAPVYI